MKILILTCEFPYPLDQGSRIRNFHLLREIAKAHDVHLLSLAQSQPSAQQLGMLEAFCASVEVFVHARSKFRKALDLIKSLRTNIPYIVLANTQRRFAERVKELLASGEFDAVQVQELYPLGNIPTLPLELPLFIDAHNCEGLILDRAARAESNPLRKLFYATQAQKLLKYEELGVRQATAVFAVSEPEQQYFGTYCPRVALVPNGVEACTTVSQSRSATTLLFVGTLHYPPNRDAVRYFLREIWPSLLDSHPNLRFVVVGRNPPPELLSEPSTAVEFRTNVETIEPVFATATVLVVPLRSGGGTRLKILQALAAGLPVVSTSTGIEGIAADRGVHALVADDPDSFAEAVRSILNDRSLAHQLAENGQRLISERYLWLQTAEGCLAELEASRSSARIACQP